jgi:hypothetical protein
MDKASLKKKMPNLLISKPFDLTVAGHADTLLHFGDSLGISDQQVFAGCLMCQEQGTCSSCRFRHQ